MKQPAIVMLALGILVGVAIGSWLPVGLGWVAASGCLFAGYPLLAGGIVLGLVRIVLTPLTPGPSDIAAQAGHPATLRGVVIGQPAVSNGRQSVTLAAENNAGKVQLKTEPWPVVAPGDVITVKGTLMEPPVFSDFDYRGYLAARGIHSVLQRPQIIDVAAGQGWRRQLFLLRRKISFRLSMMVPEPEASFLNGILLGDRSGMPEEMADAFRRTGTTHVLALSGYNISVIIAAGIAIFGRRKAAIALVVTAIVLFVLLVGPSASVVRAALMGSFILLGQALGRPQVAVPACLITAGAMLLVTPWALKYDVGFQLSFAATLGILWWERPIRARLRLPEPLGSLLATTLAAGAPTLPLIIATFHQISVVSPIANVVIVPLVPWLMLGSVLVLVVGSVPWLGPALASVVVIVTRLGVGAIERLAALPVSAVTVPGYVGWLGSGLVYGWWRRRRYVA